MYSPIIVFGKNLYPVCMCIPYIPSCKQARGRLKCINVQRQAPLQKLDPAVHVCSSYIS